MRNKLVVESDRGRYVSNDPEEQGKPNYDLIDDIKKAIEKNRDNLRKFKNTDVYKEWVAKGKENKEIKHITPYIENLL